MIPKKHYSRRIAPGSRCQDQEPTLETMTLNHTPLTRRNFIRITAMAGSAAAGTALWSRLGRSGDRAIQVQETRLLMGTIANLTVVTGDRRTGEHAVAAAFDRMQLLESILSRFQPNSQLSRLNQDGRLLGANVALSTVLQRAIEYGDLTGGAFDVTVEPLLASYRAAISQGQAPEAIDLSHQLERVDYRQIGLEGDHIALGLPGMAITLDGIAKGYVIDQGARALAERGFDQLLVEVGGDLMAGSHPDGAWRIGVQAPRESMGDLINTVGVSGQAMATSGDYLSAFTRDLTLHHILDPRSGVSPSELASVSVIAPSAMDADALSTALMVLGSSEGLLLVEQLPGVEALLVGKDGQLSMRSAGFPIRS